MRDWVDYAILLLAVLFVGAAWEWISTYLAIMF